jgi:hypothetical protein
MTDLSKKMADLAEVSNRIDKLNEEKKVLLKDFLKEKAAYIFEKYTFLESFSWTQYAPYFNDGDACVFSVNYDYVQLTLKSNKSNESDENDYDEDEEIELNTYIDKDAKEDNYDIKSFMNDLKVREIEANLDLVKSLAKDISEFFEYLDENIAQEVYGDDSKIVVSDKGIEIEDYSGRHD